MTSGAGIKVATLAGTMNSRQQAQQDEKADEQQRQLARAVARLLFDLSDGRLVFAANSFEDPVDSLGQPPSVIPSSKMRIDMIRTNIESGDVWQGTFEAVADLD